MYTYICTYEKKVINKKNLIKIFITYSLCLFKESIIRHRFEFAQFGT